MGKRGGAARALREFLYGMFGYETAQQALEIRASMEALFMLVTFGDMIGVPVMPPYYSLRLLPYVGGHGRGLEAPDAARAPVRRRPRTPSARSLRAQAVQVRKE